MINILYWRKIKLLNKNMFCDTLKTHSCWFIPPFHFSIRLKRLKILLYSFKETCKSLKTFERNLRLTIGVLVLEVHILRWNWMEKLSLSLLSLLLCQNNKFKLCPFLCISHSSIKNWTHYFWRTVYFYFNISLWTW